MTIFFLSTENNCLTLLHPERPKLYAILAFLGAIGLNNTLINITNYQMKSFKKAVSILKLPDFSTVPSPFKDPKLILLLLLTVLTLKGPSKIAANDTFIIFTLFHVNPLPSRGFK